MEFLFQDACYKHRSVKFRLRQVPDAGTHNGKVTRNHSHFKGTLRATMGLVKLKIKIEGIAVHPVLLNGALMVCFRTLPPLPAKIGSCTQVPACLRATTGLVKLKIQIGNHCAFDAPERSIPVFGHCHFHR